MAEFDPFGDPFANPISPTISHVRVADEEFRLKTTIEKIIAFAPPDSNGFISGKALRPVLVKADISIAALKEVWTLADAQNRGSLTKDELKILLSLIAMVQQGRTASLEALRGSKEVLVPNFQNLDELTSLSPNFAPAQPPPSLSVSSNTKTVVPSSSGSTALSFQQMLDRESVEIKVSDRVGTKLLSTMKTIYYDVTSKTQRLSITRRYSDFAWLQEVLLKRYPFRLIPQLPPKQIAGLESDRSLEERRRGLTRFLDFVGRHPVLNLDEDVAIFWKETDEDKFVNYKKTRSSSVPEEFYFHPLASVAKENVPHGIEEMLLAVQNKLPSLASNMGQLVQAVERVLSRLEGNAMDFVKLAHSIETVIETEFPVTWVATNRNYKSMANKFETIGRLYGEEAVKIVDSFVENLKHQQSIAVSFQELFVRRTNTTQKDVQLIVRRIQNNKARLSSLTAKGTIGKSVDMVIQQIEQDEKEVELLAKRDDFVTYCLWQEMLFFNAHKAFLSILIRDFVKGKAFYTDKHAEIWHQLEPYVMDLPTSGF